jgi:hypothetical protein
MIVRRLNGRVQLITQPDHAHLARRIMEHCNQLADHPRRDTILHAIAEHDNGWAEEDAAPTVNPATGRAFDFVNAPVSVRHAVWPRGVARLAASPWAAALVAQHALTVYDRYRSEAEWDPFFERMTAARDEMVGLSGMPLDMLDADYPFVRLADLISLTFCTGWTDVQRFAQWAVLRVGSRITVTPDAFGGATVPFAIEAREIANQEFEADAELREAIDRAESVTLRGEAWSRSR